MADFCAQCSLENFGEDYDDFATQDPRYLGDFRIQRGVLCEGCGPECIVVWNGVCVSETCLKQHGKNKLTDGSNGLTNAPEGAKKGA